MDIFSSAFLFDGVNNNIVEISVLDLIWRWARNIRVHAHYVQNIVFKSTITNMETL
jgi:hypothetical protein